MEPRNKSDQEMLDQIRLDRASNLTTYDTDQLTRLVENIKFALTYKADEIDDKGKVVKRGDGSNKPVIPDPVRALWLNKIFEKGKVKEFFKKIIPYEFEKDHFDAIKGLFEKELLFAHGIKMNFKQFLTEVGMKYENNKYVSINPPATKKAEDAPPIPQPKGSTLFPSNSRPPQKTTSPPISPQGFKKGPNK